MVANDFGTLFPAPESPVEGGEPEGWRKVAGSLKTELPADYKQFIERYGTGCIGMFIWIFNPFSKNANLNLIERAEELAAQYRKARSEQGEEACPYPLFPEPGGLLPMGITDNGDVLFWLTDAASPDDWGVVINETRSHNFERHDQKLTALLVAIARGGAASQIIPADFLDMSKPFLPADQVDYSG